MKIRVRTRTIASVAVVTAFLALPRLAHAEPVPVSGQWQATVLVNGVEVPFRFEIATTGGVLAGSFFNGERRITSTAGRVDGDRLHFAFDQYAATLEAAIEDGTLVGEYRRGARVTYPFRAMRVAAAGQRLVDAGAAPLEGTWIVPAKSSKGETAWRFVARQQDGVVSASILRVDGDTGTLTGTYRDGRYVLSHFSGARPLLLEVTPQPDGSLLLRQNGKTEVTAVRESDARAAALGLPTDPSRHTTVADSSERFRFSFPDLTGRIVSNSDAQFADKVVLVNISGSWCPNCHDEAPFLASLYKKYRTQGLEIVTLSFEDGDQLANPTRLRAFVAAYGLEHTVLLAGNPDDLNAKVPQAVNLNAFPTTFILGRDGRVRGVHAGFPSPGSGEFYVKAEQDIAREIERLLAERVGSEQ